jgi:regulator of protease activity HflC (stomatin/prohibitin superfamily)
MADDTAPPQQKTPAEALSTAKQVEELGDQLSACADSIHERVMRDIHRSQQQHHGEVPEAEQSAARALLDAEIELRQRADRLYADAAACIATSLGQPQQRLLALTADAAEKIKTITHLSDGISLVARLLGLAAAAATGQSVLILPAVDLLKTQLDAMALHNAPPA